MAQTTGQNKTELPVIGLLIVHHRVEDLLGIELGHVHRQAERLQERAEAADKLGVDAAGALGPIARRRSCRWPPPRRAIEGRGARGEGRGARDWGLGIGDWMQTICNLRFAICILRFPNSGRPHPLPLSRTESGDILATKASRRRGRTCGRSSALPAARSLPAHPSRPRRPSGGSSGRSRDSARPAVVRAARPHWIRGSRNNSASRTTPYLTTSARPLRYSLPAAWPAWRCRSARRGAGGTRRSCFSLRAN